MSLHIVNGMNLILNKIKKRVIKYVLFREFFRLFQQMQVLL